MKKNRFAYILLCLVLLPLAFLFGCGDVSSFSIETAYSGSGMVSNGGTYTDGSSVTITATAKSGSFLGWVHDGVLLSSGGSYKITNTSEETYTKVSSAAEYDAQQTYYILSGSDYVSTNIYEFAEDTDYYVKTDYISKSILTFSASSSTQGSYTALFDNAKMTYAQLASIDISLVTNESADEDTPTENPSTDSVSADDVNLANLDISELRISEGSNVLTTILELSDDVSNETISTAISNNNSVLKLDGKTTQNVQVYMFILTSQTTSTSFTLRASLDFQASTSYTKDSSGAIVYDEIETTSGTYHVEYEDGVYRIVFTFSIDSSTYQMTLRYVALGTVA